MLLNVGVEQQDKIKRLYEGAPELGVTRLQKILIKLEELTIELEKIDPNRPLQIVEVESESEEAS
jgi:hypothetical protein